MWLKIKEKLLNVNPGVSYLIYVSDVRCFWIKHSISDEMWWLWWSSGFLLLWLWTRSMDSCWIWIDPDHGLGDLNDQWSEAAVSKYSAAQTWNENSRSESHEDDEHLNASRSFQYLFLYSSSCLLFSSVSVFFYFLLILNVKKKILFYWLLL